MSINTCFKENKIRFVKHKKTTLQMGSITDKNKKSQNGEHHRPESSIIHQMQQQRDDETSENNYIHLSERTVVS
jgi:hypothetical protein